MIFPTQVTKKGVCRLELSFRENPNWVFVFTWKSSKHWKCVHFQSVFNIIFYVWIRLIDLFICLFLREEFKMNEKQRIEEQ